MNAASIRHIEADQDGPSRSAIHGEIKRLKPAVAPSANFAGLQNKAIGI
jgi:hypothetical protein